MRDIDKLREARCGQTAKSGNKPRQRVELAQPKTINSPAPKGLWRNCYDPQWLARLPQHEQSALNIIDEDYDFSLEYEDDDFN